MPRIAIVLVFAGCAPFGTGTEIPMPAASTAREKGDRAILARAILHQYCRECHGEKNRKGTLSVADHATVVASGPNPVPFIKPGDPAGSQVIQFLEDGSMPPAGRPRPTAEQLQTLRSWVAEGATPYPTSFDDDATLRLLVADAVRNPADVTSTRYLSFNHLVRDGAPPPDLETAERDLFAALRASGLSRMPTPVDPTGTLYRLDTRQAGWDSRALFERETQGTASAYPLSPYDLVLMEYPHASSRPAAEAYLSAAKLDVPVPFVRADWLTAALRKDSPLAAELRSLTMLHTALAGGAGAKLPCGPTPRAFGRLNPVPPIAKSESPLAVPRLSAWYSGDTQAARPPLSLESGLVDLDGKPIKFVTTGQVFRLRATADRPGHFTLLMVWANGEVVYQPTRANGTLEAGENDLRPPDAAGGGFTVADVLTRETSAVEYFVLLASPDPIPKPVIVRSKHARGTACEKVVQYPVYRFLFPPDAKFDPAKVVRRVIPIPVTAKPG